MADARAARSSGFTLLEIVILIAVGAIVAIVLVPAVRGFRQEALVSRALAETQLIARAVRAFRRDNGFFPRYGDLGTRRELGILITQGTAGHAVSGAHEWTLTDLTTADLLANQLIDNRPGFGARGYAIATDGRGTGWDGPYLAHAPGPDPWGGRYAINVRFLGDSWAPPSTAGRTDGRAPAVWVLSAGPDGVFDTPFDRALPRDILLPFGDDVGVRLR